MIAPDSRSLEWIEKVAAENHAPNLILVETSVDGEGIVFTSAK